MFAVLGAGKVEDSLVRGRQDHAVPDGEPQQVSVRDLFRTGEPWEKWATQILLIRVDGKVTISRVLRKSPQ